MDPNRPRSSSSSTLGWVGCGCGALVALVLASIMGLTWLGYRKGKELERTFKDPAARTEATREVLPWRELPAGYYPAGAITLSLLMKMAILSDHEPEPGEAGHGRAFEKHGLVFMSFHSWISDEQELLRWLRGEIKETPKWIRRSNAKIDPKQVLKRGAVQVDGRTIVYVVTRGAPSDMTAEARERRDRRRALEAREGRQEHGPGEVSLMTVFSLDCPGDRRARLGIWFVPDPAPGRPNAEMDLTGTNGDPEKIRDFVGHFELCK
jgi:hypothetical protein